MAKLAPEIQLAVQKYLLRMNIEDLQNAYHASLTGLRTREVEIESMVRAALKIGTSDPLPDADENDPDSVVEALYDHASDLRAQALRGATMVRNAFLVALFHAWERHINHRQKRQSYSWPSTASILTTDGYNDLVETIRLLQLAANCAKHGEGTSSKDLYALRPDFFPRLRVVKISGHPNPKEKPNAASLVITHEALTDFFDAVLAYAR